MILRASDLAPLSSLCLAQALQAAGLPGCLNVIVSSEPCATDILLADRRLRKLTFTGSSAVGAHLLGLASARALRVTVELGGSAPFIVFDDADIDLAVTGVMASKFRNAGQTCVATNRIFVQRGIADDFARRFAEEVGRLQVGDGITDGTQIGPLINVGAAKQVTEMASRAREQGAEVVIGGDPMDGAYVRPTVVTGVSDDMDLVNHEIFGPIAPISIFDTEEEVIRRANSTPYGLSSYFYTNDYRRIVRVSESLEFGMVGVNRGRVSCAAAPFGGVKGSGFGRSGGSESLDEYLETTYLALTAG